MKLTSSNFAAAIGINPYMSRQKLFRVLTGREQREPVNANMQWGIDNEHRAVAGLEAHLGLVFSATGKNQEHIEQGRYGTTPDGLYEAEPKSWFGLEAKCPQNIYDDIPAYYLPQVQGQIAIAELDAVYFTPWTPEEQRAWLVEPSCEYVEWMWPLIEEFMHCLERDEEPKRRKKPVPPTIPYERIL